MVVLMVRLSTHCFLSRSLPRLLPAFSSTCVTRAHVRQRVNARAISGLYLVKIPFIFVSRRLLPGSVTPATSFSTAEF